MIFSESHYFFFEQFLVVLNQEYEEDLAQNEGQANQEYPSIEENNPDYNDDGTGVRPNPRGIMDIFSSKPKADDIAIVNGVLGISTTN